MTGRTLFSLIALLGLLLAHGGCGVQQLARGDFEAPRVEVEGVTVGLPQGGRLPVFAVLRLTNPNPAPLDVHGYDYDLWLEGRSVARGAGSRPVHLPPFGQARVEFPVLVDLPAALNLAPRLLDRQKVHYRLSGGIRLGQVMAGLIRVPFQFQGQAGLEEGRELWRLYGRELISPGGPGPDRIPRRSPENR
ncbi:MAG: LEA type 2 family protein [Syntrophobacterales bacterium]|nr:LEA type 2 family protein [Syntrophobacterales bacterium]